jgi:hypothetical protein
MPRVWYLCDVLTTEEEGMTFQRPAVELYQGIHTGATVYHPTRPLCVVLVAAADHSVFAADTRIRRLADHERPTAVLTGGERAAVQAFLTVLGIEVAIPAGATHRQVANALGRFVDDRFEAAAARVPNIP